MFTPNQVYFEPDALEYPLGKELLERFKKDGVSSTILKSNRVTGITGDAPKVYKDAKRTMVVSVRKTLSFQSCKPSANYQLPLVTSCPGLCQYCYLQTTLGKKPFIKVYVNIDEILSKAEEYINKGEGITVFEGSATSDPIPVESYTNSLKKAIEFFANEPKGKFRFVTKYSNVDSLLGIKHNNSTTFRFSLNSHHVIKSYEKGTASMEKRIEAAKKVSKSGYPMGFLIAPIFIYPTWKKDYLNMLENLKDSMYQVPSLSFELITHRFTAKAKANIQEVFPQTTLPLEEKERKLKYGQFGYTKYVYHREQYQEIEDFFRSSLTRLFPQAEILYLV